jgi:heme-degrading monooxygenase HmoA
MNNVEIKAGNEVLTLINLFTVQPQNQEELIKILKGGAETHFRKQPGYISAAVHRSKDGKHAVVYSQWRSEEDVQRVRTSPALQQYFARVREISTFELISYEVAYVDHV